MFLTVCQGATGPIQLVASAAILIQVLLHQENPTAVALGRLRCKKEGPARAKKLTSERRKAIAKKAAQARWKNNEVD